MKEKDAPSLVRLRRLDYYLAKVEKYTQIPGTVDVVKGKETVKFPEATWKVAMAIHEAGLDICEMRPKSVIYAWADHVLFGAPRPAATVDAPNDRPAVVSGQAQPTLEESDAAETTAKGQTIEIDARIAIYTLLVSARELSRIDKRPGAEALGDQVDAVANAYLLTLNPRKPEQAPLVESTKPVAAPAPVQTGPAPVPTPA